MELLIHGKPTEGYIPSAALPDCEGCAKPELDESNFETLLLWNLVETQQTYNSFSGQRLGLRLEAVLAGLDELCRQGQITDRQTAFDRIWHLDRVYNEIEAARLKKEAEERKAASASRQHAD